MSDYFCYLITVLYESEKSLITCALKIHESLLSDAAKEFPEDERLEFYELLPRHVKSCGPIVNIEQLFEVHIASTERAAGKLNDGSDSLPHT